MTHWRERSLADLLAEHGLAGVEAWPFETDGWSGSTFAVLERGDRRFVLKHVSAALDWIVRATRDDDLREAQLAASGVSATALGAATDPDGGAAILMPDLTDELIAWGRETDAEPVDAADLDHLLDRIAAWHAGSWSDELAVSWCPVPERLTLLSPVAADRYAREQHRVGPIFQAGWAAFDRLASPAARDVVSALAADVSPLVTALAGLPAVGLHGDLKLANIARFEDRSVGFIDWQMTMRAPVAVELGWLLVSNSGELPLAPADVLARYRAAAIRHGVLGTVEDDAWAVQLDLTMLSGLLLRGWRKGRDAEAGAVLASGVPAAQDLAWWCEAAVAAADRRL